MGTTNTLSARLIGAIFLERGLVTEEQLQSALALQVETKEHLGEILVQHFGVSRIELASVLAEQWAELERANAESADNGQAPTAALPSDAHRSAEESNGEPVGGENEIDDEQLSPRPLGAIFVEQGIVTDAELDQALETQRQGGEKLGEILVAQGSITRLQLASALAEQWTALRKIRPPSASEVQTPTRPVASRETPPPEVDRLHEAVAALEQRLHAAESLAAREPWREEISAATEGLQASLTEIEARVAGAATREDLEAVESMRVALDELKTKMETLAEAEPTSNPELLRRVETAAEAATAARSSLDGAFESLSLRLADVESRVHDRSDLTRLQSELAELATRVSEFDGERDNSEVEELRGEVQRLLDEVSRRTAASSEPDPALANRVEKLTVQVEEMSRRAAAGSEPDPALAKRFEKLTMRVEEIGTQLKGVESGKKSKSDADALRAALTTLAERVEKLEVGDNTSLQELRRSLSELEARTPIESPLADRLAHYGTGPDEIHALHERIEEIERQTAELAERNPEFEEHVGTLADRVQTLEGSTVRDELAGLRDSVDELAARPVADPALADRVEQVAARIEETAAASTQIGELRAQVESLVRETGGIAALAHDVETVRSELGRLDELGSRLHAVESEGASLQNLRGQVDALAARPAGDPDLVEQLARRVDEVSGKDQELDQLREGLATLAHRLDSIAERAANTVPLDEIRSLGDRLEALEGTGLENDLTELRRAVEELAARPTGDAELAERVEELARQLEVTAGTDPQLEALGARVGELARQASAARGVAKDVEELRSRLDHLDQLDTRVVAGLDAVEGNSNAVDELRRRLDALADRPIADAAQVEQLSRRVDELSSVSSQIDGLRNRLDVLSSDVGTPAEDLTVLRRELAALEQRLDSVGDSNRDAVPSGEVTALAARLEALESSAGEADLAALGQKVDELAARPAGDPALAERVEQLAGTLEDVASTRSQLDELRARLDAAEKAATEERPDERGPRIEAVERSLEDGEARTAALATRFDDVASRLAAVDELPARIDALGEQLASHQSGHAKSVRKADLTSMRDDLAEQFGSMEQRFEELAAGARKDHESLEQKVEEIVAALTDEVGGQRRAADDRVAAIEQDAVALRSEISELRVSADVGEAWREGIEADLGRRVEKLGKRLKSELPDTPIDFSPALDELRAELSALAARVDGSDTVTAGELEALKAQFEEQLAAEAGRTEEQVRAADEALRAGLSSLSERLAETESTYLETGDALRQSIERLGAAIVDGDGDTAAETSDEAEVETEFETESDAERPFIAFVPNGSGYSIQELNGFAPVVGEPVPVIDRDGEFVVTRIGRSPLPLDRRRCAYLELRPGTLATPDRVT